MKNYELKTGKIGEKVVDTYKKIEDSFVEKFLDEKEEVEEAETKLSHLGVIMGYIMKILWEVSDV